MTKMTSTQLRVVFLFAVFAACSGKGVLLCKNPSLSTCTAEKLCGDDAICVANDTPNACGWKCQPKTPPAETVVGCIPGFQREGSLQSGTRLPTWKMWGPDTLTFREAVCRCQRGPAGHLKWHGAHHGDVMDEDPSKPNYMFMGLGGASNNGGSYYHACFNAHVGPQGAEGRAHQIELVGKCNAGTYDPSVDHRMSCKNPLLRPSAAWETTLAEFNQRKQFTSTRYGTFTDDGLPLAQCSNAGVVKCAASENCGADGWKYSDPNAYNAKETSGLLHDANGDVAVGKKHTDADGTEFYVGGWERYAVYRVPAPSQYDCQNYCDSYQGSSMKALNDGMLNGVHYSVGDILPRRVFGTAGTHCVPGGRQDGVFAGNQHTTHG
eukprot:g4995.t1